MNEALQKYIGKECKVAYIMAGYDVTGVIRIIQEHWIEVDTKKGPVTINLDYVMSIKPIE